MVNPLPDLKHWRFEIDFENIAWAIFDKAGESANTFGAESVQELEKIVTEAEKAAMAGNARALIFLSGKEKSFILGADIREFDALTREKDVEDVIYKMTGILNRIERMSIPVICGIHGYCLGGGLEFAMACHYRVATREEGTRLGQPEVKLGLFPGFNGTVRMIRLAGGAAAMDAMLTGRMIRSAAARGMGIVDQLVPSRLELRWACRKAGLQKRRSKGAPWWKRLMSKSPIRGLLAMRMKNLTTQKVREDHYPAPFLLIDLFNRFGNDLDRMATAETRYFAPLMVSETSRNLRRVFRLSELLKNEAPKDGVKPMRAHIIGAGVMGGDIAAVCVMSGMEVSLQDTSVEALGKAVERAKKLFKTRLKGKGEAAKALARLLPDAEGKHIRHADVVIEAIVERLDVKQALLKSIEPLLKPGALLATNTSSLRIEDIATGLSDPGRLIGLHFFNPVPKMPLVEVVRGAASREADVKRGCSFVTAIGKFPLITKDTPGFLVNAVLMPYMFGAIKRAEDGESKGKIDAAAEKFGMPMGPIELADTVGLDICKHVAEILGSAAVEGTEMGRLVAAGKLGKKTGEGFYKWVDGKPEKDGMPHDGKEMLGVTVGEKAEPAADTWPDDELDRLGADLIKPLIEACEKALAEGVVADADHIDAGVIFGTGFAPFRGGPIHYQAKLKVEGGATATTVAVADTVAADVVDTVTADTASVAEAPATDAPAVEPAVTE
jgi:3-hydroxyacyl-CoA dehydrogenase / enoyl-CoA hydratase / 3-hydroxybutyryl-CoA epimerase